MRKYILLLALISFYKITFGQIEDYTYTECNSYEMDRFGDGMKFKKTKVESGLIVINHNKNKIIINHEFTGKKDIFKITNSQMEEKDGEKHYEYDVKINGKDADVLEYENRIDVYTDLDEITRNYRKLKSYITKKI